MARNVRREIVSKFLRAGRVPTIKNMANTVGMDLTTFKRHLKGSPALADLGGLSPEQARKIIDRYGPGVIFKPSIEKLLKELTAIRKEIEKKEKRLKQHRR
jgi:hypothetical protein